MGLVFCENCYKCLGEGEKTNNLFCNEYCKMKFIESRISMYPKCKKCRRCKKSFLAGNCKRRVCSKCKNRSRRKYENGKGRAKRRFTKRGYVLLYMPNHKMSRIDGEILEHRYVMSEFLKRPLLKNEVVHHKNGDKKDNKIDNLELLTIKEHTKLHNDIRFSEIRQNKLQAS